MAQFNYVPSFSASLQSFATKLPLLRCVIHSDPQVWQEPMGQWEAQLPFSVVVVVVERVLSINQVLG